MQSDPQFANIIARSKIAADLLIEDALFVKCLQGDIGAIKLLTDRREEKEPQAKNHIDRQLEILRNLKP